MALIGVTEIFCLEIFTVLFISVSVLLHKVCTRLKVVLVSNSLGLTGEDVGRSTSPHCYIAYQQISPSPGPFHLVVLVPLRDRW
jgi:hypothetical protein